MTLLSNFSMACNLRDCRANCVFLGSNQHFDGLQSARLPCQLCFLGSNQHFDGLQSERLQCQLCFLGLNSAMRCQR